MVGPPWRVRRAWSGPRAVPLAVVVGAVQLFGSVGAARWHGAHGVAHLPPLAILLLLTGPAALAFLGHRRLVPLAVSITAAVAYVLLGYPIGPIFVTPAAALWLEFVRGNRERWASQRREAQLARAREVTEERVAIARELHDVLGHSLSLINVQAGVALHLLHDHPENVEPALTTIKAVSHDALEEVRAVLDTLRDPSGGAARSPAPTLADVEALVQQAAQAAQAAQAGQLGRDGHAPTRWRLTVTGTRGHLPAAVDAAAYRVVQEAMTNVRRHARAQEADVAVTYGERQVSVRVTDDGVGSRPQDRDGGGSGLTGMRERVGALGGQFRAVSPPTGGFEVFARIPWDAGPAGQADPPASAPPVRAR